MIGLTKVGVIEIVLIQSFLCSLPALVLGLITAQLLYIGLSIGLSHVLEVQLTMLMTPTAIASAILFGIVIPIVSALLPIKNALGLNLQDSLDLNRSKTKAITYSIERNDSGELNWTVILTGFIGTAFGFMVILFLKIDLLFFSIIIIII
jgi:predicted lysophospholipase L1 biosynthesis ABC-type transport system permease subunit